MQSVYALRRYWPQFWLGACTFVAFSLSTEFGCSSCQQKQALNSNTLEEGSCPEQADKNIPAAELGRFIKAACGNSESSPSIGAFYTDQSFPKELFLDDLFASDSNRYECAPGPFLSSEDSDIDGTSKRWQLQGMPKYFFVQIKLNSNDENFYIANSNGFPISCQSFKLKQQDNTTLVLLPKSKLEAGKSYYLYLIQREGESRRIWIQPLILNEDA